MTTIPAYPHEVPPTGPAAAFAGRLQDMLLRLETARLILRSPRIEDFDTYARILMSPRFPHGSGPPSRDDAWHDFCNYIAGWVMRGHGIWAVETRDEVLVGFVLVGMEPGDREPELGWMLTDVAEGHGYATEAAAIARAYVLSTLALPTLVSYVHPDNGRSSRVAERLGAWRDDAAAAAFDEPVLVYRHAPEIPA